MRLELGGWQRNVKALFVLVFVYFLLGALLFFFQDNIIYRPSAQDFERCPALADAEHIEHQGTRMYFKENGPRIAVIYHGNAGSACDREYLASLVESSGYSYIVVEYTGYSNDGLTPTHEGIKENVRSIVQFIAQKQFQEVVVLGESIGTGAASYHASIDAPSKLVLVTPFADLYDVAKSRFWFYPTSFLVDNAFDNQALLENYVNEVLIIHGDADKIIPLQSAQRLFDTLSTPQKKFVLVDGAGHNSIFEFEETYAGIFEMLR